MVEQDLREGVKRDVIRDPGVVFDQYFPWVSDGRCRTYEHPFADRATKQAQQKSPPSVERLWRHAKQRGLHHPPKLNEPRWFPSEARGQAECPQILHDSLARRTVSRCVLPGSRGVFRTPFCKHGFFYPVSCD